MTCPRSPLVFAKTKLVDSDFDIFFTEPRVELAEYFSASEPDSWQDSNTDLGNDYRQALELVLRPHVDYHESMRFLQKHFHMSRVQSVRGRFPSCGRQGNIESCKDPGHRLQTNLRYSALGSMALRSSLRPSDLSDSPVVDREVQWWTAMGGWLHLAERLLGNLLR